MCFSTARWDNTIRCAIVRLLKPVASSPSTSRSLRVNRLSVAAERAEQTAPPPRADRVPSHRSPPGAPHRRVRRTAPRVPSADTPALRSALQQPRRVTRVGEVRQHDHPDVRMRCPRPPRQPNTFIGRRWWHANVGHQNRGSMPFDEFDRRVVILGDANDSHIGVGRAPGKRCPGPAVSPLR